MRAKLLVFRAKLLVFRAKLVVFRVRRSTSQHVKSELALGKTSHQAAANCTYCDTCRYAHGYDHELPSWSRSVSSV